MATIAHSGGSRLLAALLASCVFTACSNTILSISDLLAQSISVTSHTSRKLGGLTTTVGTGCWLCRQPPERLLGALNTTLACTVRYLRMYSKYVQATYLFFELPIGAGSALQNSGNYTCFAAISTSQTVLQSFSKRGACHVAELLSHVWLLLQVDTDQMPDYQMSFNRLLSPNCCTVQWVSEVN